MKIEHVAIWVNDLEQARIFYEQSFGGSSNSKYRNTTSGFESYFVNFEKGARIELMRRIDVVERSSGPERLGLSHLAIDVGTAGEVDALTERLVNAGAMLVSAPRLTGDGYYESVVLDPEGNRLELVASR